MSARWQPCPELPKCVVSLDDPGTNVLVIEETTEYGGLAAFPDKETARRVAACWNALLGVSTEMLEAGALEQVLAQAVATVRAMEHVRLPFPGNAWSTVIALRQALAAIGRLP